MYHRVIDLLQTHVLSRHRVLYSGK